MARTLGCIHLNLEYLLLDLESPETKQVELQFMMDQNMSDAFSHF